MAAGKEILTSCDDCYDAAQAEEPMTAQMEDRIFRMKGAQ